MDYEQAPQLGHGGRAWRDNWQLPSTYWADVRRSGEYHARVFQRYYEIGAPSGYHWELDKRALWRRANQFGLFAQHEALSGEQQRRVIDMQQMLPRAKERWERRKRSALMEGDWLPGQP